MQFQNANSVKQKIKCFELYKIRKIRHFHKLMRADVEQNYYGTELQYSVCHSVFWLSIIAEMGNSNIRFYRTVSKYDCRGKKKNNKCIRSRRIQIYYFTHCRLGVL